jgi:hypothetical protein
VSGGVCGAATEYFFARRADDRHPRRQKIDQPQDAFGKPQRFAALWTLTVGINERNGRRNEMRELPLGHGVEIDVSARLLCESRGGQHAQIGAEEAGSEIHLALAKQLMTFGKTA